LKLRYSRLPEINGTKTPGIIITRRVSFEGARFGDEVVHLRKNTGVYHNPTRQRGIYGNTCKTLKHNPSLTERVGIHANAQLQNASVRDLRKHL
jgi:hypothetical protein